MLVTASLLPFLVGRSWIGDLLASFRMPLALGAFVVGVVAAALRGWVVVALAVIAFGANVAAVERVWLGDRAGAAGPARLEIGHVNMRGLPGDVPALRAAVGRRQPDVFVVLEPDPRPSSQVGDEITGYRAYRPAGLAGARVVVLSRLPLTLERQDAAVGLPIPSVAFAVPFAGRVVHVLALHTTSPLSPARNRARNAELAAVAKWAKAQHGPVVVLGDFNAVPWSAALHDLEHAAGLSSSSDGFGFQGSWPASLGFLGFPIDQLLSSHDLTVTDRQTRAGFGSSSHRSLWVTLALAKGGIAAADQG